MSSCPQAGGPHRTLDAALLIASAMNASGELELPDARGASDGVVCFLPDGEGRLLQREGQTARPADLRVLAAGLQHLFGTLTPPLFQFAEARSASLPRFAMEGREADQERVRLLHRAFSIFLLAFEEALV